MEKHPTSPARSPDHERETTVDTTVRSVTLTITERISTIKQVLRERLGNRSRQSLPYQQPRLQPVPTTVREREIDITRSAA